MAKIKRKTKMAYGGNVNDPLSQYFNNIDPTLIENPNNTLVKNSIRQTKAAQNSGNWLTSTLDTLGPLAMNIGMSMVGSGMSGVTPSGEQAASSGFAGALNKLGGMKQKKAYGGKVTTPVEVEGGEVGQLPNGGLIGFEGPTHASGGIDVNLPGGTEIFSDRIKIDGVSMADRKKKRSKKEKSLEELFGKNSTDALIKNSLNRTKAVNKAEDDFDTSLQNNIGLIADASKKTFATGGTVPPNYFIGEQVMGADGMMSLMPTGEYFTDPGSYIGTNTNGVTPSPTNNVGGMNLPLPTFGDAVGMFGNLYQGFSGKSNTLANRAGDTPNINPYENFGKKGLETLDGAKTTIKQIKDVNAKALTDAKNSAVRNNNKSARSLNTQRALNLATEANTNKALESLYGNFAQQLMGIIGQQASMETQQDQVVMSGAGAADLANRQDRDNFFSQLGRDEKSIGQAISKLGANLNQILGRGADANVMNQISEFFNYNPMTGEFTPKENIDLTTKTKKK